MLEGLDNVTQPFLPILIRIPLPHLGDEIAEIREAGCERPRAPGDAREVFEPFRRAGVNEEVFEQDHGDDGDHEARGTADCFLGYGEEFAGAEVGGDEEAGGGHKEGADPEEVEEVGV